MSRLVTLDPDIILVKEPEGYQFGKQIGLNDDLTETEVKLISLAPVASVSKLGKPVDPIPDKDTLQWGVSPEEIIQRQKADKLPKHQEQDNESRVPCDSSILHRRRTTYAIC